MKHFIKSFLLFIFLSMMRTMTFAYCDIAVKNADGVVIYYEYINNGTELSVTIPNEYTCYSDPSERFEVYRYYSGDIVIPLKFLKL